MIILHMIAVYGRYNKNIFRYSDLKEEEDYFKLIKFCNKNIIVIKEKPIEKINDVDKEKAEILNLICKEAKRILNKDFSLSKTDIMKKLN